MVATRANFNFREQTMRESADRPNNHEPRKPEDNGAGELTTGMAMGAAPPDVRRPDGITRRVAGRRSAKLLYIVPAVLAAFSAKPVFAFS